MEKKHFTIDLSKLELIFKGWVKEIITENLDDLKLLENPAPDKLLTVDEAAVFLSLAKCTVYTKVSRKELPTLKAGKRLYFSEKELSEYLRTTRKPTISDIEYRAQQHLNTRKTHPPFNP